MPVTQEGGVAGEPAVLEPPSDPLHIPVTYRAVTHTASAGDRRHIPGRHTYCLCWGQEAHTGPSHILPLLGTGGTYRAVTHTAAAGDRRHIPGRHTYCRCWGQEAHTGPSHILPLLGTGGTYRAVTHTAAAGDRRHIPGRHTYCRCCNRAGHIQRRSIFRFYHQLADQNLDCRI